MPPARRATGPARTRAAGRSPRTPRCPFRAYPGCVAGTTEGALNCPRTLEPGPSRPTTTPCCCSSAGRWTGGWRSARPATATPLPTVTHVHLHGGPKVVHRYDLQTLADGAGVYTVRPRADQHARDESVAD